MNEGRGEIVEMNGEHCGGVLVRRWAEADVMEL